MPRPDRLRYPAVELHDGGSRGASVIAFGPTLRAAGGGDLLRRLVTISATDIERMIVPNRIVLPAAAVVLALDTAWQPSLEWPARRSRRGAVPLRRGARLPERDGHGRRQAALLLGVAVGRSVPVALMVGMLAALVPSVVIVARHGVAAARKTPFPFAPFLLLAACRWPVRSVDGLLVDDAADEL